jgi:hypothetical protein
MRMLSKYQNFKLYKAYVEIFAIAPPVIAKAFSSGIEIRQA